MTSQKYSEKLKNYMVVERFKPNCFEQIYARFNVRGRMLPEGLYFLHSWVNKERNICFQLMETNDQTLFAVWIEQWQDLTDFEIFPID